MQHYISSNISTCKSNTRHVIPKQILAYSITCIIVILYIVRDHN